jgi:hypothetical protein
MAGGYTVKVEDEQGREVATTTHPTEYEARREGTKLLHDPAHQTHSVWLIYPGGMAQELAPE